MLRYSQITCLVRRVRTIREKRLFVISVRPPVFGSHWADFREIQYWRLLRKSLEKNQIRLTFRHRASSL